MDHPDQSSRRASSIVEAAAALPLLAAAARLASWRMPGLFLAWLYEPLVTCCVASDLMK